MEINISIDFQTHTHHASHIHTHFRELNMINLRDSERCEDRYT